MTEDPTPPNVPSNMGSNMGDEMREAECPFCENLVLVYEVPPSCPLCACPLEPDRMHPYAWPNEEPSPSE